MSSDEPCVSIVIPCFNVEEYVAECLDSVCAQTHRNLDVVLVDDGSTDSTAHILGRRARNDDRMRIVTQPNRGLGAARNAGIDLATGAFIFFLDSDDVLPVDAIGRLVARAQQGGADLVSGRMDQFDSTGRTRAAQYRSVFDHDADGLHISRDVGLVYDQMACSKLFRSDFWRANDFRFPEGVAYEDLELVIRAHVAASSVSVVARPTYLWRRREPGSPSITQDRYRPGSTAQRFGAVGRVDAHLHLHAGEAAWEEHGLKVCTVDARLYARLLRASPRGWSEEFFASASTTLNELCPASLDRLNPVMRLLYLAICARDRRATEACVGLLAGSGGRSWAAATKSATTLVVTRPRLVMEVVRSLARRRSSALWSEDDLGRGRNDG